MHSILSEAHFHSEAAAYAFVEARLWPDGPVCPHCGATKERAGRLNGKSTRHGLCKCYACRKPFTVKMRTVMESSHVPLRVWLQAIYLMCSSKKGISIRQLQRTFQCGMKTAWFLGHRIREAMTDLGIGDDSSPLGGQNKIVEADETFIGGRAENRKNRIPKKSVVLSLVERGGKVRSFHVPNVTSQSLKPIIVENVSKASFLMTDGHTVYPSIGAEFAGHGTVDHSAEEYVNMSAPISGTPTRSKISSRSSSAASTAVISMSARLTCIGTLPNSTFATTTGSRSASTIWPAPISL